MISSDIRPIFIKRSEMVVSDLNNQRKVTKNKITRGGVYVTEFLMVDMISKSIRGDWLVYVKEHPGQFNPRGHGKR